MWQYALHRRLWSCHCCLWLSLTQVSKWEKEKIVNVSVPLRPQQIQDMSHTFEGHHKELAAFISLKSWHFHNPPPSNLLLISPDRADVQCIAQGVVPLKHHGRQGQLCNVSNSSCISLVKPELWCNPNIFQTVGLWLRLHGCDTQPWFS